MADSLNEKPWKCSYIENVTKNDGTIEKVPCGNEAKSAKDDIAIEKILETLNSIKEQAPGITTITTNIRKIADEHISEKKISVNGVGVGGLITDCETDASDLQVDLTTKVDEVIAESIAGYNARQDTLDTEAKMKCGHWNY